MTELLENRTCTGFHPFETGDAVKLSLASHPLFAYSASGGELQKKTGNLRMTP
jgi:hypothetical protein